MGLSRFANWRRLLLPSILLACPVFAQSDPAIPLSVRSAVCSAITNQPEVRLAEATVRYRDGLAEESSGAFDTTLKTGVRQAHEEKSEASTDPEAGTAFFDQAADVTETAVSLARQTRASLGVELKADVTRTDLSAVPGEPPAEPDNAAAVMLTISQPLLKGRGRAGTAAGEEAARLSAGAGRWQLKHTGAAAAATATRAHGAAPLARRQAEIQHNAEARASNLVQQIQLLIDHGERPATERYQAEANLADVTKARLVGEQTAVEAFQALLLAMGVEPARLRDAAQLSDDFPALPAPEQFAAVDLDWLMAAACRHRADLTAAGIEESALDVLIARARRNAAPRLDLQAGVGYNSLRQGEAASDYAGSLADRIPGAGFFVGIDGEWPFENRAARGQLRQAEAQRDQARSQKDALARTVNSEVIRTWSRVRTYGEILKTSEWAVRQYEQYLASEKKKYQMGLNTLLEVLFAENQLTQALLNLVLARSDLAVGLVELRYVTGTLVREAEGGTLVVEELARLPAPAAEPKP